MEKKICTQCKRELPIEDFYWRDKKRGLRRSECKDCHNGYVKRNYQEKKQRVEEIKEEFGCQKCGDKRSYVLDFHHIEPKTKEQGIARLISNNATETHINNEIKKCVCLCANCHREFHYLENKKEGFTLEDYLNIGVSPSG